MRRQSPACYSPPRREYSGSGRSPLRRKYGGGDREAGRSLLVRNIPPNCMPDGIRIPFGRFGRVRNVYLPKDYYSGKMQGIASVTKKTMILTDIKKHASSYIFEKCKNAKLVLIDVAEL